MAPLFKCRSNRPSHQSQKTGEANLTPKSPLFCLAHPKKTDESIKLLLQRGPIHGQGQAVVAVGGQEEDGPAIHLLCHMDVLLTLHPHGVRLVPKALDVIVDIVDSLAQLCKVMDLVEMEIAINTCGPGGCMWRPHAASVCFKPLHETTRVQRRGIGTIPISVLLIFCFLGHPRMQSCTLEDGEPYQGPSISPNPWGSPLCGW